MVRTKRGVPRRCRAVLRCECAACRRDRAVVRSCCAVILRRRAAVRSCCAMILRYSAVVRSCCAAVRRHRALLRSCCAMIRWNRAVAPRRVVSSSSSARGCPSMLRDRPSRPRGAPQGLTRRPLPLRGRPFVLRDASFVSRKGASGRGSLWSGPSGRSRPQHSRSPIPPLEPPAPPLLSWGVARVGSRKGTSPHESDACGPLLQCDPTTSRELSRVRGGAAATKCALRGQAVASPQTLVGYLCAPRGQRSERVPRQGADVAAGAASTTTRVVTSRRASWRA